MSLKVLQEEQVRKQQKKTHSEEHIDSRMKGGKTVSRMQYTQPFWIHSLPVIRLYFHPELCAKNYLMLGETCPLLFSG
ncbi:hypothetical protein CHARACLAT_025197 [Characodon lateralis]|uniref:Uncharacterized protein n=1 Tax=Characodon lateralis TaxID=208331 RepID=A0ABU7DK29_9TELE|nr:hypothetical protein [Characodon lateralis]